MREDWKRRAAGAWRIALAGAVVALLAGCAGTIKQDLRIRGDVSKVQGVTKVVARMSPDATKQLADNQQFNRDELANNMRRRLEDKSLISPAAGHQIDIIVTDIRVRSSVAAILFGPFAGNDHVNGVVRLVDAAGTPVSSFVVEANYALGGVMGTDGNRMNWLYDKFSEMAVAELEKLIVAGRANGPAAPAPAPATAATAVAVPAATAAASTEPAEAVAPNSLQDVNAVPVNERGRETYRQWLTKPTPRAFVVADGGVSWSLWGTNPPDPMEPRDPSERGLKRCKASGRSGCQLYAVDYKVVYTKPVAAQR